MFLLFRKACLLYKTSKIDFHDLFSRPMTWKDRGLHGATGGLRGLQGVTRAYRGLKRVTGGDKELQGVTKDYRNFFLTRTFLDPFSWSI